MKIKIFILSCIPVFLYPQSDIPRDTSYSTYSAYHKLIKDYPFIEIAAAEIPETVASIKNIIYDSSSGRALNLDLFIPADQQKGPYPAVIMIHGGGWRSGDKTMQHPLAVKLAENGYAAVPVEYRLSAEAKYPAAVLDLKSAVRWLRANGTNYNIDTSSIAALGCSAGGTLAALLGTASGSQLFAGELNRGPDVQAVIDIDGIVDFTDPAESGKDTVPSKPSAGKLWFGASYKENPRIWEGASPLNHVSAKTPPVLFINSSDKRFSAGRDEMIVKLQSLGIYNEVHVTGNSPHTFWLFHPWFDETVIHIVNFLRRVF